MGDIAGQKNLDAAEDLRSQAVKWGGWVDDEAHFSGPTPRQALIKKALRRQALWIIWSFCFSVETRPAAGAADEVHGYWLPVAHENRFHPVMEFHPLEVSADGVRREVYDTQPWAGFGL
jgi:hypothetical protein